MSFSDAKNKFQIQDFMDVGTFSTFPHPWGLLPHIAKSPWACGIGGKRDLQFYLTDETVLD